MSSTDIHLYTTQTPNGIKISITLEELGLKVGNMSDMGREYQTIANIMCLLTV